MLAKTDPGRHERGNYYGLHMTHPGCTLPKSLIMLTHSRKKLLYIIQDVFKTIMMVE